MAVTYHDCETCCTCSDWKGLYDWEGEPFGGMCMQVGEYMAKPRHGNFQELECHSLWDRLEGMYDGVLDDAR